MEMHVTDPLKDGRNGCRERFVRFNALRPELINVELQSHTTWTDGRESVADMLRTAAERGLAALAITEHVRRDTTWFDEFARQVRQVAADYPQVRAYVGCEAKALDTEGGFDASPAILDQCDIVLGSVHRFPGGKGGFLKFSELEPEEFARIEFDLAMGLIRNAPIDVLSHPGGMYQRHHGPFPESMFAEMMRATLDRGIAIEINASYLVDMDAFLTLCREIDPLVSVGSDAHGIEEIGRCRDRVMEWFGW